MLGAVALVTAIYLLMAAGLVLSVPHAALQGSPGNFAALAGFATAFQYKGLGWAKYVVAAGERAQAAAESTRMIGVMSLLG
jgi:hypothetical protein